MKESDDTKAETKVSNTTNDDPSKNKNQEIPHKPSKIAEFLKAKKNANFDIDLSSLSKKTYTSLMNEAQKYQNKIKNKEEEIKVSNIANESQKKYGNTDIKIPENERKRKYRLKTNDVKLPSNINLLKKLCEKINKNEKEPTQIQQPIFKFEEDENNNIKNKEKDPPIKKKLNIEFEKNEIKCHKKTSSQNFCQKKEILYENFELDNMNINKKNKINIQSEINPECKNITYADSISSPNQKLKNEQQHQNINKNNNYNNNCYNKNQIMPNNIFIEKEIIKNNYFIKLKTISLEFSFMENINSQFERTMEDKSKSIINFNNNPNEILLEIFDGHGGGNVSSYLQSNFSRIYQKYLNESPKSIVNSLSMAFSKIDEDLRKQANIENQGSTGTIIHIIRDKNNRLFVYNGNVGDSRASLISPKKIIRLSQDHRTDDKEERKRIISEGGMIINNRVNGELMLTRSFGDFDFKQNGKNDIKKNSGELNKFRKGVICEPFITQIEIDQNINNQFLFLASDGVWDVMSEEDIQQLIKINNDTNYLSSIIIEKALFKKAWDNLSIFVVKLT